MYRAREPPKPRNDRGLGVPGAGEDKVTGQGTRRLGPWRGVRPHVRELQVPGAARAGRRVRACARVYTRTPGGRRHRAGGREAGARAA